MKGSGGKSKAITFSLVAVALLVGAVLMFSTMSMRSAAMAERASVEQRATADIPRGAPALAVAPDALPHPEPQNVAMAPPPPSTPPPGEYKRQEVIQIIRGSAPPTSGMQPPSAIAPEPQPTGNTHVSERPNPFTLTSEDTFSTFAVDVDTASYALFRRYVNEGSLPPRDSVRVEEWVNYFKYRLPAPTKGNFQVDLEGTPSPFT